MTVALLRGKKWGLKHLKVECFHYIQIIILDTDNYSEQSDSLSNQHQYISSESNNKYIKYKIVHQIAFTRKNKIQNFGCFIWKHKMIKSMWLSRKKCWQCKNNDTEFFRRNNAIWIILQEVVGPQSYQKIVINFQWLTTLIPCSG